ncbi:MAG: hypothetical protein Q8Q26_03540 [Pseudorhodobacter sp.]|nr:hypothetical protein [Pseudorhodobacter sp.]
MVHGIRLAALAGNIWPHANENYIDIIVDELLTEIVIFAVHSRRYLELTKIVGVKLEGSLFVLAPEARTAEYETDLWDAINRVIHSRRMSVFTVERDSLRFPNLGDRVIAHIEVQSDRGDAVLICPTALVHALLSASRTSHLGAV